MRDLSFCVKEVDKIYKLNEDLMKKEHTKDLDIEKETEDYLAKIQYLDEIEENKRKNDSETDDYPIDINMRTFLKNKDCWLVYEIRKEEAGILIFRYSFDNSLELKDLINIESNNGSIFFVNDWDAKERVKTLVNNKIKKSEFTIQTDIPNKIIKVLPSNEKEKKCILIDNSGYESYFEKDKEYIFTISDNKGYVIICHEGNDFEFSLDRIKIIEDKKEDINVLVDEREVVSKSSIKDINKAIEYIQESRSYKFKKDDYNTWNKEVNVEDLCENKKEFIDKWLKSSRNREKIPKGILPSNDEYFYESNNYLR